MTVAHNRADIILVEKAIRKWTTIDIAVPDDFNVVITEDWKVEIIIAKVNHFILALSITIFKAVFLALPDTIFTPVCNLKVIFFYYIYIIKKDCVLNICSQHSDINDSNFLNSVCFARL